MPGTDRETARLEKTRDQYDQLVSALKRVVNDYNQAEEVKTDHIRVLAAEGLPVTDQGIEGRTLVLQRRNAFVKVMMGSSGTIQLTWGFQVPATGDRVFREVNRLVLDPRNDWQFYRIRDAEEVHLERFEPEPRRMGKVIVERLIENAAIPPEVQPVLAL